MANIIIETIAEYLPAILSGILVGIVGFFTAKVKSLLNTDEKRRVAKTTVRYIEQVYKDIHGAEKLEKAKEAAISMLNEKGINITDLEITALIEEAVKEMNLDFKDYTEK